MTTRLKTPQQLFDITGKVAVVTGALGALGGVVVRTLSAAGCNLVIADDRPDDLELLAQELQKLGGKVRTVAMWPNTEANCSAIVASAVEGYGRIDILVIASGMLDVDPIVDMDISRFEQVMKVNVSDSWMMCQAAGRQMIAQAKQGLGKGGKVVLISSARGLLGHPAGYTAYCSSKHAINGIVKALGCEWGKEGITVNALGPTLFRSPLTSWLFEDNDHANSSREKFIDRIPLGRLAEPEDLAGPLLFLVSPASDFHTGHTIYPDGGYTAG